MREVAAAEKALRQKPKVDRPSAVPGRKVRMNVAAIDLPRPKEHIIVGGTARRPASSRRALRQSKATKRMAQIKFLLLCIVLATLLLVVWRNLPG